MHTSFRLSHLLQEAGRSPSHYKRGNQVSKADLYCHRYDDVGQEIATGHLLYLLPCLPTLAASHLGDISRNPAPLVRFRCVAALNST